MRISATNQHPILLNQPKPRRCLPRARQHPLPPGTPQIDQQPPAHRRDARAARKNVQRDPFTLQQAPGGPANGCERSLAAVRFNVRPFARVPLDSATALAKDLIEKGHAGQDAGRLAPEGSRARGVADDKAADVKGRRVLGQPGRDLGLPGDRKEVLQRAVLKGQIEHDVVLGERGVGLVLFDVSWKF